MKLLNELIEECIQANALFTVYDIIPEAQERGCMLSNEKITEYVKNYRYPIFYTRTIQDMGCEIIVPVYHPADIAATEYDSADLMPSTVDIQPKVPSTNVLDTITTLNTTPKLNDELRTFANQLHSMVGELHDKEFTRKEVKEFTGHTDYTTNKLLMKLEETRYINKLCGNFGSRMQYQLTHRLFKITPTKSMPDTSTLLNIDTPVTTKKLFDNRGRYHVRVADVKKAGFEIGDIVEVLLNRDTKEIVLSKKLKRGHGHVGRVKVDIYQNVSIARSPFRELDKNQQPTDLNIKSTKGLIKITPSY